ncbi:MAG: hypothetical protein F4Z86_17640 [Gemmatimonadetes bacterium]|nr:hypothetical protein [Gemmatimonadota bacterium]MYD62680.1 hypothetical protein [Gemmatimonadota bacterium]
MNTTIHTIEDLIRILDDNPEWMDALRARLLTRELIELPERFNQFVAEMNSFVAEMNSFVAEMNSFVAEMHRFVETTNRRFDALENRVASIQDDVGILKGAHARSAALRETPFIASEMGFRWVKDLTEFDLWELINGADTSGIPTNELRSFRRADLIIEATDQNGTLCYIAVEISFTANGRDTTRALRNAEFMTRFTGKQAFSAVVGLRRDDRIQGLVESGEVFWYQLDPEILEAE